MEGYIKNLEADLKRLYTAFEDVLTLSKLVVGGSTNYMDVNDSGDVVFNGSSGLAFAEIYVEGSSATISLDADLADVKITQFTTNGESNNCTADATNDKITFTKTGKYLVLASIVAKIDAGSTTVLEVTGYLNGVAQTNIHSHRSMATAAAEGSMSINGIIDVTTVDWDLDLRANVSDSTARDVTFQDITLSVIQIGGT
jgi:hypothetical protein